MDKQHIPERQMCPECGLKYFNHEIPQQCIGHCPLKERIGLHQGEIQALRDAGCSCQRPLLGYRPNVGPRCRLCNTVASKDKGKNV